jgi:hypothetical protein
MVRHDAESSCMTQGSVRGIFGKGIQSLPCDGTKLHDAFLRFGRPERSVLRCALIVVRSDDVMGTFLFIASCVDK